MKELDALFLDKIYNYILKELPHDREIVLYWTNGNIGADEARYVSERLNKDGFRSLIHDGDFLIPSSDSERREYPVDLGRMLDVIKSMDQPRVIEQMMQFVKVY